MWKWNGYSIGNWILTPPRPSEMAGVREDERRLYYFPIIPGQRKTETNLIPFFFILDCIRVGL